MPIMTTIMKNHQIPLNCMVFHGMISLLHCRTVETEASGSRFDYSRIIVIHNMIAHWPIWMKYHRALRNFENIKRNVFALIRSRDFQLNSTA